MIVTSQHLPFSFNYSQSVLSADQQGVLRVRFANVAMASAVESAVGAFEALATLGTFSGAGIDPALSTLSLDGSTSSGPGNLAWTLTRARLSDHALVPLAHLLLGAHPAASIQAVEVVHLPALPVALRTDDSGSSYPELYRDLPFELDDDEVQGDDYAFEIELDEPLCPDGETWLNHLFATWGRVVSMGAYAEAPTSAADAYVELEAAVVAWDNQVEWALFKLRADGASIDALLNGLVAFHGRCQRIRSVALL